VPRLLSKSEILQLVPFSFPTIWKMMISGRFPKPRICGGKSAWLSTEISAWMIALPTRPLKGDALAEEKDR